MRKRKSLSGRYLISKLREKYYMYDLDSIEGCQSVLIEMLKENECNIITNRGYHLVNRKCPGLIFKAEEEGLKKAEEYRSLQNTIENIADECNCPEITDKIRNRKCRIKILLKSRYYDKSRNKSRLDIKKYEDDD